MYSGISAQENQNEYKTIFNKKGDKKIDNGGYGAFGAGYTQIDGKNAMVLSFKGAWVIDHKFALGLAGYSFFNNLDKTTSSDDYFLAGGYGGFSAGQLNGTGVKKRYVFMYITSRGVIPR